MAGGSSYVQNHACSTDATMRVSRGIHGFPRIEQALPGSVFRPHHQGGSSSSIGCNAGALSFPGGPVRKVLIPTTSPTISMETELTVDKEITILSHIAQGEHVRQRDLSHVIGMSLGMTNAILKRLVHKGYLAIRKVNNRNIAYAVTPAGVEAIGKRSYRYFKRTIRNIVYYRSAIEAFVHNAKARGYKGIAFAGVSDLDFIVEHACETSGIRCLRDDASIEAARAGSNELYLLYSESYIPDEEEKRIHVAAAFLQDVVSQGAGEDAAEA